jgi:hypothetical protein
MIGSNCPEPLHAHNGSPSDQVAPLSLEISMAMWGVGQFPGQGLGSPYRVVTR